MKLVQFDHQGSVGFGVMRGDLIHPVTPAFRRRFAEIGAALVAQGLAALPDALKTTPLDPDAVTLLPPLSRDARIICVGLNYRKPYPVDGVAPPDPENIILFGKEHATLVGHDSALIIPPGSPAESFDYEAEIAMVIGRAGRSVPVAEAMAHVAGYTVFNDGSVREWQKHSIHAGKNFEKSGSCGPWITTADEIAHPEDLRLTARLNGDVVQQASAREMIYGMAEQIAYVSQIMTLRPGDIIATGSPDGTGGSRTPKRYLRAGDHLEITVQGVGTLINTVRAYGELGASRFRNTG